MRHDDEADGVRRMDDVAGIDETDPGASVERGADRRVVEIDPGIVDLRLVGGDRRLELTDLRLLGVDALPAGEVAPREVEIAAEIGPRIGELRLVALLVRLHLAQRRLEGTRIDQRQHVAGLDVLTLLEIDLDELAVDLRLHRRRVEGDDRAEAGEIDRNVALHHLAGDDRDDRIGLVATPRRRRRPPAIGVIPSDGGSGGDHQHASEECQPPLAHPRPLRRRT